MQNWRRKFIARQRNIAPHEAIPNSAFFEGTLFRGKRHLNTLQRIGATVYGLCALFAGSVCIAGGLSFFKNPRPLDVGLEGDPFEPILSVGSLVVGAFIFFWGFKVTLNALGEQPQKLPEDDSN